MISRDLQDDLDWLLSEEAIEQIRALDAYRCSRGGARKIAKNMVEGFMAHARETAA